MGTTLTAVGGVRLWLLATCILVSFLQSVFFAYALVPEIDDALHMFLGRAALTGEISLFQDELTGHRMGLSYYWVGLSQFLWPRSVVAARLFSAGLGVVAIVLVFLIARRLAGELAAVLAMLFAVTQGFIIGYFALASYHSLISVLLLGAIYVLLCTRLPGRRMIAMGLVSLVFFTRTLVIPVIPFMCLYLLWDAKSLRERLGIVAVAVMPPLAFFLSDVNHLKLIAHVPVLNRLVLPLGFGSHTVLGPAFPHEREPGSAIWSAIRVLVRWYKVWLLAAAVLLGAVGIRILRGLPVRAFVSNREANLVGALLLYLVAFNVALFFPILPSWAVGYSPTFAILGAICLGVGFAILIESIQHAPARRAILVFLAALFFVAPALSRHPNLPKAVAYDKPPTQALYDLGNALAKIIPPGSRVFHVGATQAVWMAGRNPYLRQVFDLWTLAPGVDERVRKKSGLWGEPEIREWLTRDADYAVVLPTVYFGLYGASQDEALQKDLELIDKLLAENFTQVATLDQYPGLVYYVYKRKPRG
jgi:hypothetical protein